MKLDSFIAKLKEADKELKDARKNIAGLGYLSALMRDIIEKSEESNKNIKPNETIN